jgi:hypothetical protein
MHLDSYRNMLRLLTSKTHETTILFTNNETNHPITDFRKWAHKLQIGVSVALGTKSLSHWDI